MLNGISSASHLLAVAALVLLVRHLTHDGQRGGLQLRRIVPCRPRHVREQEYLQRPPGAASAAAAGVLGAEVKAAGSGREGGRQWMLHTLGMSWPSSRAMKSRPSENSSLKTTTCITGRVRVMLCVGVACVYSGDQSL